MNALENFVKKVYGAYLSQKVRISLNLSVNHVRYLHQSMKVIKRELNHKKMK